jgi:hypothetical protein
MDAILYVLTAIGLVAFYVGPVVWAARLAPRSGRSAVGWGIAAALFGPIALLYLYQHSWKDLKEAARAKKKQSLGSLPAN